MRGSNGSELLWLGFSVDRLFMRWDDPGLLLANRFVAIVGSRFPIAKRLEIARHIRTLFANMLEQGTACSVPVFFQKGI